MDEKDWLLLKILFERKSLSKASRSLYISQPALSTRLQQIEENFNTKIVVRCKKGVQFTPEGEYLVKTAYEILKKIETCKEKIQNMCEVPTGTLRIGASHYFTKHMLPELLRCFKEKNPHIEFSVITNWSRDIVSLTQNYDVHIGFVRGDFNWLGEKKLLLEEKMYVAALTPFSLADLPYIPGINYHKDTSNQLLLDRWWNDHFSKPTYIGMEVDKVDTSKEMVAKGLGYAFLPGTIFDNTTNLSKVEMTFKSGQPMVRKTWMIYQQEMTELKLVRAFLDFIEQYEF